MSENVIYKCLRLIIYTVEFLLLYSCEQIFKLNFLLSGADCMPIIALLVSICFFETESIGLGFGIFAGLLIDFAGGHTFGRSAIFFAVIGYVVGVIANYFVYTNVFSAVVISLCTVGLLSGSKMLINVCFHRHAMFCVNWICLGVLALILVCISASLFYINKGISYRFSGEGSDMD